MRSECEVLVIGGGIVGLTAALAMAKRGHTVTVLDAGSLTADSTPGHSRVYAINDASQRLLQELAVWRHLDVQRISPYHAMYVWDSIGGAHIKFDSRAVAEPSLGCIIEESILKQALFSEIALLPSVRLVADSTIEEVHHESHAIRVSNTSHTWSGQLLMIADGAHSPTRQQLGVGLTTWSYQQQALVATVTVEKAHQRTAYQVFNPDGPLAFLPLPDPHQCSIVWSTDPGKAQQLCSLSEEDFNAAITGAFGQKLGQAKRISDLGQFPLHMRHVKQYVGERWLLLGDAAHTIHPLAGLGLNLGLADVSTWIRSLDTQHGDIFCKKRLGAYQRERKYEVWKVIGLMEGLKRFFGYSFAPAVTLRGMGLSICNQLSPVKRLLIQHARGVI